MVGIVVVNAEADLGPFLAVIILELRGCCHEVVIPFPTSQSLCEYVGRMTRLYQNIEGKGREVVVEHVELPA